MEPSELILKEFLRMTVKSGSLYLVPPKISLIPFKVREAIAEANKFVRTGFSSCTITASEELLRPATKKRSTRSIGIDLASNPSLT